MHSDTLRLQESTARETTDRRTTPRITGPHARYDREGHLDHRFWRCEHCGLESTDPSLREGCWRCGVG